MSEPIIVYTSTYCLHSRSVERFLKKNNIEASYINIDGNKEARERVMALNNGFASVPTLVFADGSHLTEPSFGTLRDKFNIKKPSLGEQLRGVMGK